MLRPSMGDQIPTDPDEIAQVVRPRLVEARSAGGDRAAGEGRLHQARQRLAHAGRQAVHDRVMVEGEARPVMTRAGSHDRAAMAAVRHRRQDRRGAGHAGRPPRRRRLRHHHHAGASRPGAATPTCRSSSTAGTRSSSRSPASRSRRATGSAGRNPELDKIIEQIRTIGFDDPKGLELGREYVKLAVREMPIIPLMSYNVFTVMDETYWTGYPTAERPLHRSGAELGQLART